MKLTIGAFSLVAVVAVLGAQVALADPPPSSFDIDFSDDAAIWNPFDDFEACESFSGVTGCISLDNMVCNGKGNCVGDCEFSVSGGGLDGSTSGPALAKATCKATGSLDRPVCKASLRCNTAGTIVVPGVTCDAEIGVRVGGPVYSDGFFEGKGTANVCLTCDGRRECAGGRGLFEYDVNPPMAWSLTVEVSPSGRKLEGTGTDSLGFSYTAKGSYKESRDQSSISLSGEKDTESNGARIMLKNLVTMGASVIDGTAKISVQGNRSTVELGE